MKKPVYLFFSIVPLLIGHYNTHSLSLPSFPLSKKSKDVVQITEKVPKGCVVTLNNAKGNITIKSWKHNKIVIEAHKKGSEVDAKNTHIDKKLSGNAYTIATSFSANNTKCTVDYDIIIPESARLQSVTTDKGNITIESVKNGVMAKTEKGKISIENSTGPLSAHNLNGAITIIFKDPTESKVLALAGKGNITITVPDDTDAKVMLTTKRGRITSDHIITTESLSMKYNKKTIASFQKNVQGVIGNGEATHIKAHTSAGNIALKVS